MKKRFSKILGVAVTLAMVSSLIVAPIASALSAPAVTITAANAVISKANAAYTITFNVGAQLSGANTATVALPDIGESLVITAAAATDVATISLAPVGAFGVAMSGAGTYTAATGVIAFAAIGETATITTTAAGVSGSWTQTTGSPTAAINNLTELATVVAAGGAWTAPDIGDSIVITAAAATDTATFTTTAGAGTVVMSGAGTYAAGVITFAAIGETATFTATAANSAGTWARTAGVATAAAGADVDEAAALGAWTANGDTITVTLPVGTTVAAPTVGVQVGPGWINGVWTQPVAGHTDDIVWTHNATTRTITGKLGNSAGTAADVDYIGESAQVRLAITGGITNPAAVGDYSLTVKTSKEPTAATSNTYSITAPLVLPNPGTVELFNPAGILMNHYTGSGNITAAITAAGPGYTVKVHPGTYDEAGTLTIGKNITVVSTGGAAETIIADINGVGGGGDVSITASKTALLPGVVLDGFTIKGNLAGGNALSITGEGATVQNCVFTKAGSALTAVAQTMIQYSAAPAVYGCTITGNTFDTTLGGVADIGIDVTAAARMLTISGNTFSVDMTAAYAQDEAIQTAGGISATTLTTIAGNTITGTSGNGVNVTGGVAYLTGNTLSGLWTALDIDAGSTTVKTETMTGNGVAISTTMPTGAPAVDIKGGTVTITNSTIADSAGYAVRVGAAATPATISIMFNQITGNAKNVHTSAVGTVNATHNWWGAATGPAAGTIVSASPTTALVDTTGFLGSEATGSFVAAVASLIGKTTVGVDVTTTPNTGKPAPALIGIGNYTANPQAATPEPALEGGFYDVYLSEATAGDTNSVLVKFYNANVTENTAVYVWSELRGDWAKCEPTVATAAATQGINTFSGYAWVKVTNATVPAISDLAGTPFALVEPAAVTATAPAAPSILAPSFGNIAAPVQPTFTWTAVATATSYEFVLAEEIGQDDKFAIIDYSATTDINGHVAREQLKWDTVYNWRVRAVNDVGAGDWTTGFFTTVAEPEPEPEPAPPVIVKETPPTPAPEIILQVPPATKQEVQVIPDYLLWVVVAVGAVLIIAVVVLIVRTRRVT